MLLDLKNVFQNEGEKLETSFELRADDVEIDSVYPFKSGIKVNAAAVNRPSFVELCITADFDYTRPCDRCLTEVTTPMHFRFEHRLAVSLNGEENGDYIETPDYKLDIRELALTDIILQLPSKYLCRDDCKGLCPKCGQNLNEKDCGCTVRNIDPRMEKLMQLLD